MVILKCDKCGYTEENKYFNPKLIDNIENELDYHKFWYVMVTGSGSYIGEFPANKFYIEEINANLCNACLEQWEKFKHKAQDKVKATYKEFMDHA